MLLTYLKQIVEIKALASGLAVGAKMVGKVMRKMPAHCRLEVAEDVALELFEEIVEVEVEVVGPGAEVVAARAAHIVLFPLLGI